MILAVMARKRDGGRKAEAEPVDDSAGTLADAISAHLELKKEHGADPDSVEQELESALAPARRDQNAPAAPAAPAAPPADSEPADPQPAVEQHQAAESQPPEPVLPEPTPPEPTPPESTPPEPPTPEPVLPIEDTGSFEFDWEAEAEAPPPPESTETEPPAVDVLEQTPEFFEETPEYDRLWFEERSPRDFDF